MTSTKIQLIISIVNVTLLIINIILFVIFQFKTFSQKESIAQRSGAFDKPKPSLYFNDEKLLPQTETRIIYGSLYRDQSPIIAKLPLQIVNEGTKTLKNVSVTIRYPEHPNMLLSETELLLTGAGILDGNDPKRTTSKMHPFRFASWFIKDINPKIMFGIGESFRLTETKQINTFLDYNTNQWLQTSVEYSLLLLVTISAEDIEAQDYLLLIKSIKSATIDDLRQKYYATVMEQSKKLRKSMSFIKYLSLYLGQTKRNEILVFIPKDNDFYQKPISYYPFNF
jgi:hypothetical protein